MEAARYVEELKQRVLDLEQEKARFERERKDFEQWKQKEADQFAAELVGISRSTAYEHWSYARVRLKTLLDGR